MAKEKKGYIGRIWDNFRENSSNKEGWTSWEL